jgi:hypothetical protein
MYMSLPGKHRAQCLRFSSKCSSTQLTASRVDRPNVAWSLISRPIKAAMKDSGIGRHKSSIEIVVPSGHRELVGVHVLKLCVSLGAVVGEG